MVPLVSQKAYELTLLATRTAIKDCVPGGPENGRPPSWQSEHLREFFAIDQYDLEAIFKSVQDYAEAKAQGRNTLLESLITEKGRKKKDLLNQIAEEMFEQAGAVWDLRSWREGDNHYRSEYSHAAKGLVSRAIRNAKKNVYLRGKSVKSRNAAKLSAEQTGSAEEENSEEAFEAPSSPPRKRQRQRLEQPSNTPEPSHESPHEATGPNAPVDTPPAMPAITATTTGANVLIQHSSNATAANLSNLIDISRLSVTPQVETEKKAPDVGTHRQTSIGTPRQTKPRREPGNNDANAGGTLINPQTDANTNPATISCSLGQTPNNARSLIKTESNNSGTPSSVPKTSITPSRPLHRTRIFLWSASGDRELSVIKLASLLHRAVNDVVGFNNSISQTGHRCQWWDTTASRNRAIHGSHSLHDALGEMYHADSDIVIRCRVYQSNIFDWSGIEQSQKAEIVELD